MTSADFVLLVDKPEGPTSHDVVGRARRALDTRRIGHTGTLDPFASGLLVLCVGHATRLSEYLTGLDKSYVAEARMGVSTDTLDPEGRVIAESDEWSGLTEAGIGGALESLVGEMDQVPPQYSAKKVAGEAMHRKARRGETVPLAPVRITVRSIDLDAVELPLVRFRLNCSTGTYVRSLARDLGERLGVGAHLTSLRRTAVGGFRVEDAVPVDELGDAGAVARARLEPIAAVAHLERIDVDADAAARLRHGQRVRLPDAVAATRTAIPAQPATSVDGGHRVGGPSSLVAVAHGDDLVAIGRLEDGLLKPRKVFAS